MTIDQIAAQLYTVRDHCRTAADLAATARKLRAIGYRAVQLSGLGPIPDAEILAILHGEGLAIAATHEPSSDILEQPERVVERLNRLGCTLTAYPYPHGVDFGNPASVHALIDALDRAGATLRRAGITLAYHNHAIEFVRLDGRTVLDVLLERTDPKHVAAELDTYWVHFGGGDVVAWCERLAGRMPFIHIKDYAFTTANVPQFAAIGAGNLDWHRIIPAAERSGCEWFIVEQDTCPGDPFVALRHSFEYLTNFIRRQKAAGKAPALAATARSAAAR